MGIDDALVDFDKAVDRRPAVAWRCKITAKGIDYPHDPLIKSGF